MDQETWAVIPGYEGRYEASDLGRIRSLWHMRSMRKTPHVLSPKIGRDGRCRVLLYDGDGRTEWQVHRAVLWAHVGPCPKGQEGCHGDGDHKNNRLSNLRWDTRKANAADAIRHGTFIGDRKGDKHPLAKFTPQDIRCIRAEPKGPGVVKMLARCFGASETYIYQIRQRRFWGHLGEWAA